MRLARAAGLAAWLALVALCLLACSDKVSRPDGWRRPVFYPGNLTAKVVWATQITQREPMDFIPIEDGGAAVWDDSVYVGGRSKTLFRLHRKTGKILAKRQTQEEIFSTPLAEGPYLYFGTSSGKFYALDKLTLADAWVFDAKAEIASRPVLNGDMVYFLTQTGTLTALDSASGRFVWEHKEPFLGAMSIRRRAVPLVNDGVVYQGFANGNMCALDAITGKLLWRKYIGKGKRFDDVNATPVFHEGQIYTASFDSGVYCMDSKTGTVLWHNKLKSASGALYIDGKLYLAASEYGFYCIDAETGKTDWFIEMKALFMKHKEGALSEPVRYMNDYLVFSASGTGIYFVDFRNQRLVTRFTPGKNGVSATPTVSGQMIYALSDGGWVYGIALAPKGRRY